MCLQLFPRAGRLCGVLAHWLSRLLVWGGSARGALYSLRHTRNVAGYLAAASRSFTYVACHLVGGGVLLLHCSGDGAGDVVDLVNHSADRCDCFTAALGSG